jgi:hypothetical protein
MQECEQCGKDSLNGLTQRRDTLKWVCFPCLPAAQVDRIPGWRDREAEHARKSTQAKRNFNHERSE